MVTKMKRNKLEKALKNAIAKSGEREILQCVHYDEEGYILVTDSHVLLKLDNFHDFKHSFNLNLYQMTLNKEAYPAVAEHIIPRKEDATLHIGLNYLKVVQLYNTLKDYLKEDWVSLDIKQDYLEVTTMPDEKGETARHQYELEDFDEEIYEALDVNEKHDSFLKLRVSPKLLNKALEFFMDYLDKKGKAENNPNLVNIYFEGPLRPILFLAKDATYLVTPMRVFDEV